MAGKTKLKQLTGGEVAGDLVTNATGDVTALKSNLSAVTDPVGSNDNTQGYLVGSRWINTSTGSVFVCVDASTGAAIWTLLSAPTAPVYGTEYHYAESLGLSTTTSTTFQNKLTLNTSLPAGTYRVGWGYAWSYSSTNNDFVSRVEADGTTYAEHQEEPQDNGADQVSPVSGFFNVTFGSAGSRSFTIDYRSQTGWNTARISHARLEVWRVS